MGDTMRGAGLCPAVDLTQALPCVYTSAHGIVPSLLVLAVALVASLALLF
jgi:hypothetical protein